MLCRHLFLIYLFLFFSEYGTTMIPKLADHYYPGPEHADDRQQFLVEWQKAKYDLLQWKEDDLPQAIRQGEGSVTATDWCLSRLLQPTYRSHYPMLSFIAEVCLSCPVSNAWPERAASVLKWQKSRLRSRIKNDLLNQLLQITINGPKQESKELPTLIREVVAEWLKEKNRRKLKRPPAISTVAASSAANTAQSMPEIVETDPPQDAEADVEEQLAQEEDLAPSPMEPNYDAYVPALQLQDCDDSHSVQDSDYESDYFSD